MTTLHLLIEDEYVEGFVNSLDKEKVKVIEAEFELNKSLIQDVVNSYTSDKDLFTPYYDSMKEMSIWLKEQELKWIF